MTDIVQVRPGTNRGAVTGDTAYFHDNADGSYDLAEGAHLRGWDSTDLKWYRLPVDHATGALLVSSSAGGGGSVTQGTSPWVTNDPGLPNTLGQKTMAGSTGVVLASDHTAIAVTASWASAQHVIVDTAPSTAVTNAGTFSVQASLSAGSAVIGHVIVDSGTLGSVTFAAPQHVIVDSQTTLLHRS